MADRSQPDANNIHSLIAVSNADGISPVTLWADPTTHALVTSGGGGTGGTVIIGDGTNTANVLKSDGTSAGNNALKVAGSYQELASLSAGSLNADLVPSTDVSGYKWVSIHVISTTASLSLSWQGSNDNTNWAAVNLVNSNTTTGTLTQTVGIGNGQSLIYAGPVNFRYFRARATAYTSGSVTGTAEFYSSPSQLPSATYGAAQNGAWTVGSNSATGSAVPANAFLMGAQSGANLAGLQMTSNLGDGHNGTGALASQNFIYNGTLHDRTRSATAAAGTTGTGVPAAGMLGFDGTNYQRVKLTTTGQYNPGPQTSGGVAVAKIASAATTNATSVKASAGQVYGWSLFNTSAATKYFKFYNKATAPTVGTDTPVFIVPIPPSASVSIMLGDLGTPLATGIAYAITGAVADTDTTAVALNDVVGSVFYS